MVHQLEEATSWPLRPVGAAFESTCDQETQLSLTVSAKRSISADVVCVSLVHPDGEELPAWSPGAHIDLNLDDSLVRQYSLCGDIADRRQWDIGVLHRPDGRGGSEYIHRQLSVGDVVSVTGPRNNFELVVAPKYVLIAGGIGITPLISMVDQIGGSSADWSLAYIGRTLQSMAFVGHLTSRYPGRVSTFPKDQRRLTDVAGLLAGADAGTKIYACGPESLLRDIESAADALGLSHMLHTERFQAKELPEGTVDTPFEVEFASSGVTAEVGAGTSILEVARSLGIPASFSCSEGTCGTCETVIVAGRADHRDAILSREEQKANETLMICVSRSVTPKLTLEM